MTKKTEEKEVTVETAVATTGTSAVATTGPIDFTADAGSGFEDTTAADYAIPFLRQLQSLSPQCKKMDPAYLKGAEEGDFYNTVTERLYKGDKGVYIIPCHYIHKYNEWAPGRGGFRGSHTAAEYATLRRETRPDDKGNPAEWNKDTGNMLQDAREHYVLVVDEDGNSEPALLVLTGSQLKKSRKWMTQMQGIRINGMVAPMFSQMYLLSSVPESNDKGSWAGVKITHIGTVSTVELYNSAKNFRDMVRSGVAKAVPPAETDDVSF